MTRRQLLAAERLAPLIAWSMWRGPRDPRVPVPLRGDMLAGWQAGWRSRRSVVRGQPPDTVEGWAGWLAVYILIAGDTPITVEAP